MKCERISMALVKFLAALAALTIFATAALYAEFNAGSYFEERTGSIHQTLSPVFTFGATYDAGAYPLYPISLPADTGQEEVRAFCNTCHSTRYITMQPPLPRETWTVEVNKMIKTYGAAIPDDSTERIVRYLQAHFSVETRKR